MQEFRRSVWIGFLWSIVFGTVLHFLYGWTGENRVVGLYAAISESPWEHLKLLFFPVLVYTVWEYIWVGHRWKGYVLTRAEGAELGNGCLISHKLRPDAGRGSTAGHADHYCPLLHLYRHLRQALALGRYSHICAGCGSNGILDMETHAPRQRRFMAGDPAVCRRCRLLRDLQSVPADGGDIWEPLKERCHK